MQKKHTTLNFTTPEPSDEDELSDAEALNVILGGAV
jgi:hypothetical protein|nr:MAG TPA: hypothetical protein [Caudoviricetes sp.]